MSKVSTPITKIDKPKLVIKFPIEIKHDDTPKELTSVVTYEVAKNGIYMIKKLPGDGNFVRLKVEEIPFLAESKNEVKFLSEKIPFCFYQETIRFFKYVSNHFKRNLEAYCLTCWNPETKQYFLYVPEHTVSGIRVEYNVKKFQEEYPGCYITIDNHSHNSMSSFFSGTDSADDMRDRYSGVIGFVNRLVPESKFRFGTMGKFFDVEMDALYEDRFIEYPYLLDFEKEIKKIKLISEEAKSTKVVWQDKDDLRYYRNFGKKNLVSDSHYSNIQPSPEEMMKAYGWSFT